MIPKILEDCETDIQINSKDLVLLSCVSEHLEHLPEVIESCWKFTKPGGMLYLTHGNYYAWAGHHQLPREPKNYVETNEKHNLYIDWKHYSPLNPAYHNRTMNRVRLIDVKKLIEKYYIIEHWEEKINADVYNRLTPSIRNKWKTYTLSEMLCNVPKLIARKRDVPTDVVIDKKLYFHPTQSIENELTNYIMDPLFNNKQLFLKLYRKEYMNLSFHKNELCLKIINYDDNNETHVKKIKSLGIHFLLAESLMNQDIKYKLSFDVKSNMENIKLKIYTGKTWIILETQLSTKYQNVFVTENFQFQTKSKYRIGIDNPIPNLEIKYKNIQFERQSK